MVNRFLFLLFFLASTKLAVGQEFRDPSSLIAEIFENNEVSKNIFDVNDSKDLYLLTTPDLGKILRSSFKDYAYIENSSMSGRGFTSKYLTLSKGSIYIFSDPAVFEVKHSGLTPIIVISNLHFSDDRARLTLYSTTATSRKVPSFNYMIATCRLQIRNGKWFLKKVKIKRSDFVKLY